MLLTGGWCFQTAAGHNHAARVPLFPTMHRRSLLSTGDLRSGPSCQSRKRASSSSALLQFALGFLEALPRACQFALLASRLEFDRPRVVRIQPPDPRPNELSTLLQCTWGSVPVAGRPGHPSSIMRRW